MKPKHLLLPVFTGLIATAWLLSQRHSIATLEKENAELKNRIERSVSHADAYSSPSRTKPVATQTGEIDWKAAGKMMGEMYRTGRNDIRALISLEDQLAQMTTDEILAGLDDIAALDLDSDSKSSLVAMVVASIGHRDPRLALDLFVDRMRDANLVLGFALAKSFKKLAEDDPAQMTQWLDDQIKAGKFEGTTLDGYNERRNPFEAALLGIFLKSDVAAASARLAKIPANQRARSIHLIRFAEENPEAQHHAYAQIVREHLSETERAAALSRPLLSSLSETSYSTANEYLNRIEATPEERTALVENFAEKQLYNLSAKNKLTLPEIDTMREWAHRQSPDTVDLTTGKALAKAVQDGSRKSFIDTSELVIHYHKTTGNDIVLSTFLEAWPALQHKEESRILAEKIADPELRERILTNLK